MSKARLLAPWVGEEDRSAIYHCVSRIVGRAFLLGRDEKEQFVRYMRLYTTLHFKRDNWSYLGLRLALREIKKKTGAFLRNLRFSSVMVPAPLLRRALIDQEITPPLVSFETQNGIMSSSEACAC